MTRRSIGLLIGDGSSLLSAAMRLSIYLFMAYTHYVSIYIKYNRKYDTAKDI